MTASKARPLPTLKYNFVKTTWMAITDPIGLAEHGKSQYGDIFRLKLPSPGAHITLLFSPEIISLVASSLRWSNTNSVDTTKKPRFPMVKCAPNGLLFTEGRFHRASKEQLRRHFEPDSLDHYAQVLGQTFRRESKGWARNSASAFMEDIQSLLLNALMEGLLGFSASSDEVRVISRSLSRILRLQKNYFVFGKLAYLDPLSISFHSDRRQLRKLISSIILKQTSELSNTTLVGRFKENCGSTFDTSSHQFSTLVDNCITFMVAGVDTVSTAIVWATRILAERPDIIREIRHEATAIFGNGSHDSSDYRGLVYSRMVLLETLRLFPSFPQMTKQVQEEFATDDYLVPAKTWITIPIVNIHRDPRWYRNPEKFDPERWRDNSWGYDQTYSYMPFGFGLHRCIGWELALLEGSMLLALIFSNFEITLDGHTKSQLPTELKYNINLNLTYVEDVHFNLREIG